MEIQGNGQKPASSDSEEYLSLEAQKGFLMTRDSHPEIMNLYATLCSQSGMTKYPVYLVDSPYDASAIRHPKRIHINANLMNNMTPSMVCAVLGHEAGHLEESNRLKKLAIKVLSAYGPVVLVFSVTALRALQNESPDDALATAAALSVASLLLGQIEAKHFAEYKADETGAKLAGPETMICVLKQIQAEQKAKQAHSSWPDKLEATVNYPSTENRIAHIERKFADRLKKFGGKSCEIR